jgi:hypothetical protein
MMIFDDQDEFLTEAGEAEQDKLVSYFRRINASEDKIEALVYTAPRGSFEWQGVLRL